MELFLIVLSDPRVGPRGGKAKPSIDRYVAAGTSQDDALAAFKQECPGLITETTTVDVLPTLSRVWRAA